MKAGWLLMFLVAALFVFLPQVSPEPTLAQPSGTTFVAKFLDPLPVPPFPPGSTVDQLSPPDVNDTGDTAFYAQSNLGPCGVASGDGTFPLTGHAADGDPSPEIGNPPMYFCGRIAARPLTNSSGDIAYAANIGSTGGPLGLYLSPGLGMPTKIVKQGDSSGDPAGTFGAPSLLDLNNGSVVLFSADVTGDTIVDALFSGTGYPTINTLVKVNDPVPGGDIATLGDAVMNNSGEVAFKATVTGSVSEGIFLRGSGGNITRVVAADDIGFASPALDIAGTEESSCDEAEATCVTNPGSCDDDGDGRINDGCAKEGDDPETSCRNAIDNDNDGKVNDGCPRVAEVRFNSVDEPAINDNGVVAFYADLPSPYSEGYFLMETSSAYEDGSASCADDVDNGGDTVMDENDSDCTASTDPHEDGSASCSDGIDNGGDGFADNGDSDCLQATQAVVPENPSIVGSSFGSPCGFDLAGSGPHLLGGGGAFGGGFIKVGCGGDPVEAVMVFPAHQKLVISGETIPGGGGSFTGFSNPSISDSSFAAFNATADSISGPTIVVTPGKCKKDSDGDGLCDDWEDSGMDEDNDGDIDLDLSNIDGVPADKDKKDIFVEIDYMDCAQGGCEAEGGAALGTCGDGIDNDSDGDIDGFDTDSSTVVEDSECNAVGSDTHHHQPIQAAINAVKTAFANSTAYNPTDAEDGTLGNGTPESSGQCGNLTDDDSDSAKDEGCPSSCNDGIDNGGDTIKDAEDDECTGINLHVIIDEPIRHYQYLDFPATGKANPLPCQDGVGGIAYSGVVPYDFNDIKDAKFGTAAERADTNEWKSTKAAKQKVFHYALFTHMQAPNNTSSGCAEIVGNDLYVSLGAWGHEGVAQPQTCADGSDNDNDGQIDSADSDCTSGVAGTQDEHEGTFMHELGHNLGLLHGGGEDINYKPNYLSVMNYTFQMSYIVPGRPLDYSPWVLPTPVEDALLNAIAGVSPVAGSCTDGIDNGADTVKDSADPDCQRPLLGSSEGRWAKNCNDSYDNDNDGNVDEAADCGGAGRLWEGNPANYCGDNYDNDNDGLSDFEDPDCSIGELNEFSMIEGEGIDDGAPPTGLSALQTAYTEFPNEWGVDSDGDTNPEDLNTDGQIKKSDNEKGAGSCYDTIDNDADTLADAADADCVLVGGVRIVGEGRGTCSNTQDDDWDAKPDVLDEDCQCLFRRVSATGSIDWNINNSIEGAGANLNVGTPIMDPGGKCLTAVPNVQAAGWDDWHNLNLNFRSSQNYSGGLPSVPVPEEQENPPVPAPAPVPIGGIAEYPDLAQSTIAKPVSPTDGSGSSRLNYGALAGGIVGAVLAIGAGGWYARRRWIR